jgi:hypothetical protein
MHFIDILTPYIEDIIITLLGVLGVFLGKIAHKYLNTNTKIKIADVVVHATEQLYKDLNGKDKFDKAVSMFVDELGKKGLKLDPDHVKLFIESAVNKMNQSIKTVPSNTQPVAIAEVK